MPINPEILAAIRDSMRQVVAGENGTASFVFEEFAVPVAGKTGTAQTPQILPHAWFASYAPAEPYTLPDGTVVDRPEIAVVVIMENAGEGSEVAAPVARRIYELYYGITPQKPFPW
jgi:penicillin-binding protein 2